MSQIGHNAIACRSVRAACKKWKKVLDLKNAEIAQLRAHIVRQAVEIESLQPRSRKKVKITGNDRFATTKEIVDAKNASLKPSHGTRTKQPPIQPEIVARAQEMLTTGLETIREQLSD